MERAMKLAFVMSLSVLLFACSSNNNAQENQANDGGERYALYNASGVHVSQHNSYKECSAATVRHNIRKMNNDTGITKTYQRTASSISQQLRDL